MCLAHCALFADLTESHSERVRILKLGEFGSVLVGVPVFISYTLYRYGDMRLHFQTFCVVLAVVCGVALHFAGSTMQPRTPITTATATASAGGSTSSGSGGSDAADVAAALKEPVPLAAAGELEESARPSDGSLRSILCAIFSHRSFWAFVLVNFVQIINLTVNANFLPLFEAALTTDATATASSTATTSDSVSKSASIGVWHGLAVAVSEVAPPLLIVALSEPLSQFGTRNVIRAMFYAKTALSSLMLLIGRGSGSGWSLWLLALYLLLNRTCASATFGLFNLPISDLIDEDQTTYNRAQPLSAMYFGVNALITKPAQSLGPMAVLALLTSYGYRQTATAGSSSSSASNSALSGLESSADPTLLRDIIFLVVTVLPLIAGVVQLVIWQCGYTLFGHRLSKIKDKLSSQRRHTCVTDENCVQE